MKIRQSSAHVRKTLLTRMLIAVLALAIVLAGIVFGVRLLDRSAPSEATFGNLEGRFDKPAITYQGKKYVRNTNLKSYLFLGVDSGENGSAQDGDYRSGGQCDFLLLMVIDSEHKTVRRVQIDRDTMAEITVLGVLGNELGTSKMQICLAHGFGDGLQQSCKFSQQAVERLLGIQIDGYFSMNLNGIVTLNDLLGGVTVTLEDDFSHIDPAMTLGATLTLHGEQAETYVRGRMNVGDGTNEARMKRQRQFLNAAMGMVVGKAKDDAGFIGTLFDGLKTYTVTDLTRGKMINEANKASKFDSDVILTLSGEHVIGADGFVEFHADTEATTDMVLDVFYDPEA